jgi:hypothetical protein
VFVITKLDKENNLSIREKNWGTEHSKGNNTVPVKVVTTCTEGGQTDCHSRHCDVDQKDEGT